METALPLPVLPLLLPVLLLLPLLPLPLPPPLLLPLLPRAAAEQGEPGGAAAPPGAPAPPGSSALPRPRPRRVRGSPPPRCAPCPAASARGVAASAPSLVARGGSGCALRYRERPARLGGGSHRGWPDALWGGCAAALRGAETCLRSGRGRTDPRGVTGSARGVPVPSITGGTRQRAASTVTGRRFEPWGPCPWRLRCHGRIPLIPAAGRVSRSIPERIVRDVPAGDAPPHPLLPASEPEAQAAGRGLFAVN